MFPLPGTSFQDSLPCLPHRDTLSAMRVHHAPPADILNYRQATAPCNKAGTSGSMVAHTEAPLTAGRRQLTIINPPRHSSPR